MKVDLHIHTYYSDGVFSPEQIIDTAIDSGLDVIALTDHDNVLAYKSAIEYAKDKIELIKGVEVNTIYKGYEVHILGYFMDCENDEFKKMIEFQQNARIVQTKEIISLLQKKAGIRIKFEDIENLVAKGGSIGRPHIAKAIAQAGGVTNVVDAYAKYINDASPVYVQRKTVTPHDACEIIYDAGGIPVFAHPYDVDIADDLIQELISYGLRGIEAYHRKHSPAVVEYYSSLAEKYGLIITGGSDFHAPTPNHGQIYMGKNFVPDWVYDELVKERKRLKMA